MKAFFQWLLSVLLAVLLVPITVLALPWFLIHSRYGIRVLIAQDQHANALCAGYPDEMISARAARSGWTIRRWLIDLLFLVALGEKQHCERAYRSELARLHLPTTYRAMDTKHDVLRARVL